MTDLQKQADKIFLALTLWREARGENEEVIKSVGFVILNRVRKGGWYGTDISSVIFKKYQFSSLTDPKDRQLTTWPLSTDKSWQKCLAIADDLIENKIGNKISDADSYYDISIREENKPKWATQANFIKQIGRLRFYKVS
jgi:spore germination cell wall hydrolase CwlJ-like protein